MTRPTLKPERATNEEFLSEMMNYSPAGALVQAFVLQAIEKYADAVIAAGPEAVDTPLVAGRAWHLCATDIKRQFVERYHAP